MIEQHGFVFPGTFESVLVLNTDLEMAGEEQGWQENWDGNNIRAVNIGEGMRLRGKLEVEISQGATVHDPRQC